MAITKEKIFDVANQLDAAGQSPTLAAVRKALGSGSFTTISEAMTEWKASRAAREAGSREALPTALEERLAGLGADLWALAVETANGRLASERASLEASRLQLEAAQAEAAELADQVSVELEATKAALTAAQAATEAALREAASLRQALTDQQTQSAIAQARAEEIEKRVLDLNAELSRVNQHNADLVAGLAAAAQRAGPSKPAEG